MIRGQKYYSSNQAYYSVFQDDGNLCVYKVGTTGTDTSLWCSGTNGHSPAASTGVASCSQSSAGLMSIESDASF